MVVIYYVHTIPSTVVVYIRAIKKKPKQDHNLRKYVLLRIPKPRTGTKLESEYQLPMDSGRPAASARCCHGKWTACRS